jgi:hypothetical protein
MAYQKVQKKAWETPELIAARAEAIRMHTVLKYSANDIAKILGKNINSIVQWLKAARVYRRLTKRQLAKRHKFSIKTAHRQMRESYEREIIALKKIDRSFELCLCKECGIIFKPLRGVQDFCSVACRTKFYLNLNRKVIAEKAKRKSELFHKSRAEGLYFVKNPKCRFCQNQIPFLKFFRNHSIKYCLEKCSHRALAENRKSDPNKAAAYKVIRKNTYLKRQLNGKNTREKREYYQNNIQARIAKNLRARLYLAVKKQGGKKSATTMELVGTDWPTLSAWIQSKFQHGMAWNNYGLWHIDHIKACVRFDLTKSDQQRACFHYKNLQPLWETENIKKGAKDILPQTILRVE